MRLKCRYQYFTKKTIMFNPQPKPKKSPKEKKSGISTVGSEAKYICSDGSKVSQSYINQKLTILRKSKRPFCECCGGEHFYFDLDHTLSQDDCKSLHITEHIWAKENTSNSGRECHMEWERYKSGKFQYHKNVIQRMTYLKKWAPLEFRKRMAYISESELINTLNQ